MRCNLGKAIVESGKTQAQIAGEVGLDRSTVSLIVAEKKKPSLEKAFALAKVLGRSVDDLFMPTMGEMFRKRKRGRNAKVTK